MSKSVVRFLAVVSLVVIGFLSGCAIFLPPKAQARDQEILNDFLHTPCTDFHWFGANEWILKEAGSHSGGTAPYEVYPRSQKVLSYAHGQILLGRKDSLLVRNPAMLFPLLQSRDTEVVLTALYCYREMPTYDMSKKQGLVSSQDLQALGLELRHLLAEHRDTRVRCMAADVLEKKMLFTVEDVDAMLSDKALSIRLLGIESVLLIMNLMEHGLFEMTPWVRPTGVGVSETLEQGNHRALIQDLVPVLLKHLDDHHFSIRMHCYASFLSLVEYKKLTSDGRRIVIKPQDLPKRIDWARESWWQCRASQQALLVWWKDHGRPALMEREVTLPKPFQN